MHLPRRCARARSTSSATTRPRSLLFEPGADTNLRAVIVPTAGAWAQKTVFQPLADGIVDLSYGGFNDLAQIAKGLCASIANPGGNTVATPIPCLP